MRGWDVTGLSFVFAIAYDWRLALRAIAAVWDIADEIIVGWDGRGRTWGGDRYPPIEAPELLDELGVTLPAAGSASGKLRLVVADFWAPGRDRRGLQVAERMALTWLARPGNWVCTVDADEELLNPDELRAWALRNPPREGVGLTCGMTSVYKVIGETALIYDSPLKRFHLALPGPGVFIERLQSAQEWIDSPAQFLHWHMGRTEEELRIKLRALCPVGGPEGTPEERTAEEMIRVWRDTTLDNYFHSAPRGATCYPDSASLRAVPMAMLRAAATAEGGAL